MDQRPSILIRCDGNSGIGLGHVVRCLALAKIFSFHHGCHIVFAMRQGPIGFSLVEQEEFPICWPSEKQDLPSSNAWLLTVTQRVQPDVVVLDVRDDLSRMTLKKIRRQGRLIVTIDDPSERCLEADLAFFPPVPQVQKLRWPEFAGQIHAGWEWVIVRDEFRECVPERNQDLPTILVSMGGSDPAGMTLKALQALEKLEGSVHVIVVLGRGFQEISAVTKWVETSRLKVEVRIDVEHMSELMRRADLALSSYGGTSYELAAMGVPAVSLCLTSDHRESAMALQEAGVGICLGVHEEVEELTITQTVMGLLADPATRQRMANKGRKLVDGLGAHRIANLVLSLLHSAGRQQGGLQEYQSLSS